VDAPTPPAETKRASISTVRSLLLAALSSTSCSPVRLALQARGQWLFPGPSLDPLWTLSGRPSTAPQPCKVQACRPPATQRVPPWSQLVSGSDPNLGHILTQPFGPCGRSPGCRWLLPGYWDPPSNDPFSSALLSSVPCHARNGDGDEIYGCRLPLYLSSPIPRNPHFPSVRIWSAGPYRPATAHPTALPAAHASCPPGLQALVASFLLQISHVVPAFGEESSPAAGSSSATASRYLPSNKSTSNTKFTMPCIRS
jgi:hypothetical protein